MQKKGKKIIIISIILTIIILLASMVVAYFFINTAETEQSKFFKYISQNIDNTNDLFEIIDNDNYKEELEKHKYTGETQLKINYIENIGTSSESAKNPINNLKIQTQGKVDNENEYNYQNIKLLNKDDTIMQIEYLKENSVSAVRFSDLFKQYIALEDSNLAELLEKIGYKNDILKNMPIEIIEDIKTLKLTEEEKTSIKNKYSNIIAKDIPKDYFSEEIDKTISINGNQISANTYILKIPKEQLNNIYISILEELKQDEIVLNKIEKIQEILNKYEITQESDVEDLKESFAKKLDEYIKTIQETNIGQDVVTISVYENDKKTVKTVIDSSEYEVNIEYLSQENNKYVLFEAKDKISNDEKEQKILLVEKNNNIKLDYENKSNSEKDLISFEKNQKMENDKFNRDFTIKYENLENRVEAILKEENNIDVDFEKENLKKENCVILNNSDENKLNAIKNKVSTKINEKLKNIQQTINWEEIQKVGENLFIINYDFSNNDKSSKTEIDRFNTQFEFIEAKGINSENTIKIVDSIKNNLIGAKVSSSNKLRLELDINNFDEKVSESVIKYIEKNEDKKFDVSVEYDDETGVAKYVVITIN